MEIFEWVVLRFLLLVIFIAGVIGGLFYALSLVVLVLGIKFTLEIIARILLYLFTRKKYHLYYLSGFIKGFLIYKNENSSGQ